MGRPKGIKQHQISFKIDNDLWEYVQIMGGNNRNRWLNNIIKQSKKTFEYTQKYIEFKEQNN